MSEVMSHRPPMNTALQVGRMIPFVTGSRDVPSKSHGELTAIGDEHRDRQPMTVRCARCPNFVAVGTAGYTREMFAQHLQRAHPELATRKRKRPRSTLADIWAARREQAA